MATLRGSRLFSSPLPSPGQACCRDIYRPIQYVLVFASFFPSELIKVDFTSISQEQRSWILVVNKSNLAWSSTWLPCTICLCLSWDIYCSWRLKWQWLSAIYSIIVLWWTYKTKWKGKTRLSPWVTWPQGIYFTNCWHTMSVPCVSIHFSETCSTAKDTYIYSKFVFSDKVKQLWISVDSLFISSSYRQPSYYIGLQATNWQLKTTFSLNLYEIYRP